MTGLTFAGRTVRKYRQVMVASVAMTLLLVTFLFKMTGFTLVGRTVHDPEKKKFMTPRLGSPVPDWSDIFLQVHYDHNT